jgi:hypothetical protein
MNFSKMKKNKQYFYGFWLCIPDETIVEFIHLNNTFNWEWNDICDMLNSYKRDKENDLEYPEAFPLTQLGEENPQTIQYWFEQFLETYKKEIFYNTVYLIKTPN